MKEAENEQRTSDELLSALEYCKLKRDQGEIKLASDHIEDTIELIKAVLTR